MYFTLHWYINTYQKTNKQTRKHNKNELKDTKKYIGGYQRKGWVAGKMNDEIQYKYPDIK